MALRDFPALGRKAADDAIWLRFARKDPWLARFVANPGPAVPKALSTGMPILKGPIAPVQVAAVELPKPRWQSPAALVRQQISGVTRDSTGAPLGSVEVKIIRTEDNLLIGKTTSDAVTGEWTLQLWAGGPFYLVEYLVGSPDRAGTSLRTLIATQY
jgi:hypothetical protein